ncbi:nitroreductase family protein [Sedimentibacter sp.]|uniref:nitroreductase family protein n=1 Tax=Sedimentibacter sp. TaxID=1960295 RepID=UPI002898AA4F|nr:nitroreductase family protein [Sedimentibacter sp.]
MLEIIKSRRSIRKFKEEKLPKEIIVEILKAGLLAPTSKNKKPVEFIVVEDKEAINKLKECKSKGGDGLNTAACAIVVACDCDKSDVWVEDSSIAASYMQLQIEELGLGSVWIQMRKRFNDNGDAENQVRNILNIPDYYGIVCILAIGYKNDKMRSYDENDIDVTKVHYEKY